MYYNIYQRPFARAELAGGSCCKGLRGWVSFYDGGGGVLVSARVMNLPDGDSFWGFIFMPEGSAAEIILTSLRQQESIITLS